MSRTACLVMIALFAFSLDYDLGQAQPSVQKDLAVPPLLIGGAKLATETQAKRVALAAYYERMGLEILATEGPARISVVKAGFDIPDFATKGQLLWEVRIETLENETRAIIWIHPNTEKVHFVLGPWDGKAPVVTPQESSTFEQLTLTIESDRQEVLPLEPLPVTLTLANETTTSIRCKYMLDPRFGDMWFEVAPVGEPFEVFLSSDWGISDGITQTRTVEPGFRESISGYLYYADQAPSRNLTARYLFPTPGAYRLKAVLPDRTGQWRVESNALVVQVVEPTDRDADAYQYMSELPSERPYGMFLVAGRASRSNDVRQKQEQFLAQFSEGQYAHYMRYALGDAYCLSREAEDMSAGIRLLEQAAADSNDIFAFRSLKRLVELARRGGDPRKADEYRGVIAQKFPNSVEAKDYLEEPNRMQREADAQRRYRELQEMLERQNQDHR